MPTPAKTFVSPEEYLDAERRAETKSEYFGGEVIAMPGARLRHNKIVTNIVIALGVQLRDRDCDVLASDMRVKVSRTGAYVYPDVVVVCGDAELEDEHNDNLLNPRVIFEVLSPSTEAHDRTRKWDHYRRLPSLAEYLLVAQDDQRVEHFTRQEDRLWLFEEVAGEGAVVRLPSIACTLPLAEVYRQLFD